MRCKTRLVRSSWRVVSGEYVDKEVVHVDDKPSFHNHIAKGVVHESLEGSGRVGESKEHHRGFKHSLMGDESGLPLVAILDSYICCYIPIGYQTW